MAENKKIDKKIGKQPTESMIFTFCFNPNEQTLTFAGNISIIEAARLLQNKVFDSITMVNNQPPKDGGNEVKKDVD